MTAAGAGVRATRQRAAIAGLLDTLDEFVHAARRLAQLQDDRDSYGCRQCTQQIARGVEDLPPRQVRQRRVAVLVAVVGVRRQPRREGGNRFHYVRHDTCMIVHVNGVASVSAVAAKCG